MLFSLHIKLNLTKFPGDKCDFTGSKYLFNLNIVIQEKQAEDSKEEILPTEKKVGRNEKCPCGSGKKFKHCCGNI